MSTLLERIRSSPFFYAAVASSIIYSFDVYYAYNFITDIHDGTFDAVEGETDVDETVVGGPKALVDPQTFARVLENLVEKELTPDAGLFEGIDDPALEVFKQVAVGLGGPRALATQLQHPFIARGILAHSTVLATPYERAEKTSRFVSGMLYGKKEDIILASRSVRGLHNKVKGDMQEAAGIYDETSPFDAASVDAITWVGSTLPDSAIFSYELYVRRLTEAEKDAIVRVGRRFLMCFGVVPTYSTWRELKKYQRSVRASGMLSASKSTKVLFCLLASNPGLPQTLDRKLSDLLLWYTFVQLSQPYAKDMLERPPTFWDRFVFALLAARMRFLYRLLPPWLNTITPAYRMMDRFKPRSALAVACTEGIATSMDRLAQVMIPEKPQALVDEYRASLVQQYGSAH